MKFVISWDNSPSVKLSPRASHYKSTPSEHFGSQKRDTSLQSETFECPTPAKD